MVQKKCFMGANTGDGFVHFFNEIADMWGLKKLYILKGGSGVGKNTFIKKFAGLYEGHDVILIYCSADINSLDGAIIEDLGIGMVDGTAPHIIDHKYPGLCEEIIDLAPFIDGAKLKRKGVTREQIDKCMAAGKQCYANVTKELKTAKEYHRELESLYAGCVDFSHMDEFFNTAFAKI